jgi:hypothetical protein
MAQTMLQYVFAPTPGADLPALLGLIKESADLWRKHGAQVSVWSVQVGEVGNMAKYAVYGRFFVPGGLYCG